MNNITFNDINTCVDRQEPRIHDLRLAEMLKFSQSRDIRKMILRHENALKALGTLVCATVAQTPKGGRPTKEYWLNEKQALFICTKSEAPNAIEITIEMVEVFYAVKTGKISTPIITPKPFDTLYFDGAGIRVFGVSMDKPYFVGKDLTRALGFRDTRSVILKRCQRQITIGEFLGSVHPHIAITHPARELPYHTVLIPESDVYRIAVRSTLPQTDRFIDWFENCALPSLRQAQPTADTPEGISPKTLEFVGSMTKAGAKRYHRLAEQMRLVSKEMDMLEVLVGQMYDPLVETSLHLGRFANKSTAKHFALPPPEYTRHRAITRK